MSKVYILQESSTRDGLNFDYFCKDVESLKELAKSCFIERFAVYDVLPEITEIGLSPAFGIFIRYTDEGVERVWNNYSYITVDVV